MKKTFYRVEVLRPILGAESSEPVWVDTGIGEYEQKEHAIRACDFFVNSEFHQQTNPSFKYRAAKFVGEVEIVYQP